MNSQFMYIVIISLYFIAMIGIGVFFSKRVSDDKDYFLAKDKLSAPVIGFSFSATQMSGSTYMGTIGTVRGMGYSFVPSALSSAAAPWFCYVLVGDRIRKISARFKCATIADIFEARFGRITGIVSAVIIIIASIPSIAAQLKAAGTAFEVLIGIPYVASLFLFGGIVVVYTLLGGMFAVAWTDLIQGILMILGMTILLPVVLVAAGGFTAMHEAYAVFNPNGISFQGSQPLMWIISGFLVWGFYQIGGQPAAVTRFQTTSDSGKLKRALIYSIIFESIIFLFVSMIAIAAGALIPELKSSDMALPMLIQTYLHPILGGVVLAAALGAMMSTVDSVLLMVSSIFVNNIYIKAFNNKDISHEKVTSLGRTITVIIGVAGLLIAIKPPDAILWIITMGFSIMAAAFTFPLLLGLWWSKATDKAGLIGIISGAVAAVVWYVLGFIKYHSLSVFIGGIWPAVFGSLISLIVVILVSKITEETNKDTIALFFDDSDEVGA
jgi:SSS family transporter